VDDHYADMIITVSTTDRHFRVCISESDVTGLLLVAITPSNGPMLSMIGSWKGGSQRLDVRTGGLSSLHSQFEDRQKLCVLGGSLV
jgi:hypothetical protein